MQKTITFHTYILQSLFFHGSREKSKVKMHAIATIEIKQKKFMHVKKMNNAHKEQNNGRYRSTSSPHLTPPAQVWRVALSVHKRIESCYRRLHHWYNNSPMMCMYVMFIISKGTDCE